MKRNTNDLAPEKRADSDHQMRPRYREEWFEVSLQCIDLVCAMKRPFAFALLGLPLLFAACEKAEVKTYRVPKTGGTQVMAAQADNTPPAPTPKAPSGGKMANTDVPTASGDGLTWKAPANWTAKAPGAMRRGSYTITDDRN